MEKKLDLATIRSQFGTLPNEIILHIVSYLAWQDYIGLLAPKSERFFEVSRLQEDDSLPTPAVTKKQLDNDLEDIANEIALYWRSKQ